MPFLVHSSTGKLTLTHNTPAHSQRRLFGSGHLLHSYQKRGSNDYQKSGEVLRVRKPSRMVINVFIRRSTGLGTDGFRALRHRKCRSL